MNAKRVMASVLAGAMVLSLPLTVAAKDVNEGGATGVGNLVSQQQKKYFDVVLPTNTVTNVNFRLDPQKRVGNVVGFDATDYNTATQLYFDRTDYEDIKDRSADGVTAAKIWGSVENIQSSGKRYDNTSNWMTVKNKSAVPVTIELATSWESSSDIEFVTKKKDLKNGGDPQIYMAIQAATGHTDGVYTEAELAADTTKTNAYSGKAIGSEVGTDLALESATAKPYGATPVLLTTVYGKITDGVADPISIVHTDDNNAVGLVTKGNGEDVWLSYYMPTVNYNYVYDGTTKLSYNDPVVTDYKLPLDEQAFYLKAGKEDSDKNISVNVWDNRTERVPGQTPNNTKPYDDNVNVYPTFAFRLTGEANQTTKWKNTPTVNMKWKVTMATFTEKPEVPVINTPILTPNSMDLKRVIDDKRYTTIDYTSANTSLSTITWDGTVIWDAKDPSKSQIDISGLGGDTMDLITVDAVEADKTQRVWIRGIALMNWSNAGCFVDDQVVVLKFNFANGTSASYTIKDSEYGNGVIINSENVEKIVAAQNN